MQPFIVSSAYYVHREAECIKAVVTFKRSHLYLSYCSTKRLKVLTNKSCDTDYQ